VIADGKKSSGGTTKKKRSSKSNRKKNGKTSDHDESDNVSDATDGYDTCSSEKCLQPTGEWLL